MEHKSHQPVEEQRKTLRIIKKVYLNLESQMEQLGYKAGYNAGYNAGGF